MGLREQNILAGIFMLHWSTMMFGFLVEYVSVPKYHADYTKYRTPIGPEQFNDFVQSADKENWTTQVDYSDPDRGRNALKLIDQAEWEGDTPAADLRTAHQRMEKDAAAVREQGGDGALVYRRYRRFIWSQKCRNYVRRMVPHVIGWFPMTAAWVMIINALEVARRDLEDVSDQVIPDWVYGAIWGTVVIFWSFTVVQILFQFYAPGYYWGTELIYCTLSLTAKLYLGWFLLINVVQTDSAEGALGGVPID